MDEEQAPWFPWNPYGPQVDVTRWKPTLMTLVTGELAFNDSEEWRHECEARSIAEMSDRDAQAWLFDVERARGPETVAKLRATVDLMRAAGR